MKYCEVMRCKREALGLTQDELAKLVGVSSASISSFENGGKVREVVKKMIEIELENHMGRLSRKELLEANVLMQATSLKNETNLDYKLNTLNYMIISIGKLALELRKEQRVNKTQTAYCPDEEL